MKRSNESKKRSKGYMNIEPTFGDAMQIDQALYQLAAYDTAKGLIMIPETADQAMDMQRGIAKRFNYFKRLIQNAEISFGELQRTVVDRNGPFPSLTHNLTSEQAIEKVLSDVKNLKNLKNPKDPKNPTVESVSASNVIQKLLDDIIMVSLDPNAIKDTKKDDEFDSFFLKSNDTVSLDPLDPLDKSDKTQKGKNGKSKQNKNSKNKKDT